MSCNNSTQKAVDDSAADKIAEEEIPNFPKKDTIRNTDESKPEIPNWLLGINDVMNKGRGQYGAYEIHKYTELSDSLSASVFEYSDGVCLRHILRTYLRQKEIGNYSIFKTT